MHVHSSYLYRMTALYAIQVLTESLDVDMLSAARQFGPARRSLASHSGSVQLGVGRQVSLARRSSASLSSLSQLDKSVQLMEEFLSHPPACAWGPGVFPLQNVGGERVGGLPRS